MFAIFSLRRPNILPVGESSLSLTHGSPRQQSTFLAGDLGVQRGVCLWYLSLHAPQLIKKSPTKPKSKAKKGKKAEEPDPSEPSVSTEIPSTPKKGAHDEQQDTPAVATSSSAVDIPPAFTPSIAQTLNKKLSKPPSALPDGLTVSVLQTRLDGKKVKFVFFSHDAYLQAFYRLYRGAFLTPNEMEALTENWKPYRSLGRLLLFVRLIVMLTLST
jgi:DNA-3-methyladenine glycosylase II